MSKRLNVALILLSALISACTTSLHGSFVTNSYIGEDVEDNPVPLGPVESESCQTRILYLFASGAAPSTSDAIQAAKDQYEDTRYLADISIQEQTKWKFGYSIECISVSATAY